MTNLRSELPELPERMKRLPVEERGYPVPWFVSWLGEDGKATERGVGKPDFRIIYPGAVMHAHLYSLCWLCGDHLGSYRSFVIGPMCAVNRVSSEPPSHLDCADFAARACPFLARPHARRRETGLPEEGVLVDPAGVALDRNPGVALVWTTRKYRLQRIPNGVLFNVGDPEHVRWYCEGRHATRGEIIESIDSGLPELAKLAKEQGPAALRALGRQVEQAMVLLPSDPIEVESL